MGNNWKNIVQHKWLLAIIGVGIAMVIATGVLAAVHHKKAIQDTPDQTSASQQSQADGSKNSTNTKQTPTTSKPSTTPSTTSPDKKDTPKQSTPSGGATTAPKNTGSGSGTTPSTPPASGTTTPPVVTPASYPSASNTGPSGCSSYTTYTGSLNVTTDGTVLSCIRLTGTLYVNANNVTVQNSLLIGTDWWGIRYGNTKTNATGLRLLNSKLSTVAGQGPDNGGYDYGVAQETTGYMEIASNDISGYKDGVTASNAHIHDNYIHGLSEFSGAHSQGVYVYPGSQVKIEHNTIINSAPLSQATAAIYVAPDAGHQNDRIITDNVLGGGAYAIYGGDSTATNIVVTNNKITTQVSNNGGYYGVAAYWQSGNSSNVWSGNTWYDGSNAGKSIAP